MGPDEATEMGAKIFPAAPAKDKEAAADDDMPSEEESTTSVPCTLSDDDNTTSPRHETMMIDTIFMVERS